MSSPVVGSLRIQKRNDIEKAGGLTFWISIGGDVETSNWWFGGSSLRIEKRTDVIARGTIGDLDDEVNLWLWIGRDVDTSN